MDEDTNEEEEEWFRVVAKKDKKVLLHWWYYPESYDSWHEESEGYKGEPEDAPAHKGPWKVSVRWLLDSHKFNEWMDEEDYEIDGNAEKLAANRSSSSKAMDAKTTSSASPKTPLKKVTPQVTSVPTSDVQNRPESSSNYNVINVSENAEAEGSEKKAATKVESFAEQYYEIIIPSYTAWFSFSSINDIEKRALPEFFDGKSKGKTPTLYTTYRDFMIHTYRLNPYEYLTVTACRRNLVGDVCSIIRVHAFLEQWGLINYQVC